MDKKLRTFSLALAVGFVFTLLMSMARFGSVCDEIRDNVVRIHILANSDSTEDQHLKLLIRDSLVAEAENLFEGCNTKEEALLCLDNNLERLQNVAQETADRSGLGYTINLSVKKAEFETRDYENFTLPAGEYDALCVSIGEAKGQNWWCVMFPTLCIGAATETAGEFTDAQTEIITNKGRYKVKFKAVEIMRDIRNLLKF